jgi:hypothetical protein
MRDAVELLRAANPTEIDDLINDPQELARKDELLRHILAGAPFETPQVTPARPRRRMVVAIAIAILAMLAAAAVWLATREPVREKVSVSCFKEADLTSDVAVVTLKDGDPIGTCRNTWEQGAFGTTSVPALQPCVLKTGALAVLPAADENVCQTLGLALPEVGAPGAGGSHVDTSALQEALVRRFHDQPCKDEAESRRVIGEELTRVGATDWRIELVQPFDSQRRCGSISLDEGRRTVLITPFLEKP